MFLSLVPPLAAGAQTTPSPASADSATADTLVQKNFTRAALEVTGINVFIWGWCRYIREGGTNTGFRIGIQSWKENLLNGFEWDDNHFSTNQLAHPYHGSMYFCSARANGFDFYESIPFAFAGSAMWEYFGETHHASINDWITTSVGGMTMGEMLHRLSEKVWDQRATGSERVWREVGGLLTNPMGGINRLLTGEMTSVGSNRPDRARYPFLSTVRVGARMTGEGSLGIADTTRPFFQLRGVYGDPMGSVVRTPFQAFSVDLQFNAEDAGVVGRAEVVGVLRSWETGRTERSVTTGGFVNGYDYVENNAYTYGSQSLGATLRKRWRSDQWTLNAGVTGNWIVLGATSSDYASYTGRTFDYGPGLGGEVTIVLNRGRMALALESELDYLRIMNGTEADHVLAENRVTATLPVSHHANIGAEYGIYNAERHYAQYPDVSKRAPQLLVYLAWL